MPTNRTPCRRRSPAGGDEVRGLGVAGRAPRAPHVEHDERRRAGGARPAASPLEGRPGQASTGSPRSSRRRPARTVASPDDVALDRLVARPGRRSSDGACSRPGPSDAVTRSATAQRRPRAGSPAQGHAPGTALACGSRSAAGSGYATPTTHGRRRRGRRGQPRRPARTRGCAGRATAGVPRRGERARPDRQLVDDAAPPRGPRPRPRASAHGGQHPRDDRVVRLAPGRPERVPQVLPVRGSVQRTVTDPDRQALEVRCRPRSAGRRCAPSRPRPRGRAGPRSAGPAPAARTRRRRRPVAGPQVLGDPLGHPPAAVGRAGSRASRPYSTPSGLWTSPWRSRWTDGAPRQGGGAASLVMRVCKRSVAGASPCLRPPDGAARARGRRRAGRVRQGGQHDVQRLVVVRGGHEPRLERRRAAGGRRGRASRGRTPRTRRRPGRGRCRSRDTGLGAR